MKKVTPIIFIFIVFSLFVLFGFNKKEKNSINPINNKGKNYTISMIDSCLKKRKQLHELIKKNAPNNTILNEYKKLRAYFKQAEPYIAFIDPEFYKERLNGAPLLKIDSQLSYLDIKEPVGLQVIDELIVEKIIKKEQLDKLLLLLEQDFIQIKKRLHSTYIQERFLYKIIRNELLIIYTLGITGFDTPGTLNCMEDTKNALKSLLFISSELPNSNNLYKKIKLAINYVDKNTDLNSFDYFTFYKDFIQPSLNELIYVQKINQIEFDYQVLDFQSSVEDTVSQLFSEDFFNPSYFGVNKKNFKEYKKIVELGNLLFFDPVLSNNNLRSCASCHNPKKGFTDQLEKSISFNQKGTVLRNSPTLINSILSDKFFYDLRVKNSTDQIKHVIFNHNEFRSNYEEIIKKLNGSDEYKKLFNNAFVLLPQNQKISDYSINTAISAYVQSLISFQSTFDKGIRNEKKINSNIIKGYNLFMGKAACATCHFPPTFAGLVPPLFNESESEVLGVLEHPNAKKIDADLGRINNGLEKEKHEIYKHSFKTPTLRNIEITFPYMHNGKYSTLQEILDFYNSGGGNGKGLNLKHQTLSSDSLQLNEKEINDIIEFLNALTDTVNLTKFPLVLPKIIGLNNRQIGGEY